MNIQQSFLAMDACFKADITPHFIGLHGIGKSAMIYQYAALRGYDVVEIRVGLMADAGDLVGIQEFIKCQKSGEALSTRHVLPDWFMKAVSDIQAAAQTQRPVIIFVDELNRGHKDLLQAIFELVYDRSLKGVKMRKGCQVVAASNPPTGDYNVLDFNDAAFQDRFVHIALKPTHEEFLQYGRTIGKIDSSVTDFISDYPKMLENDALEAFDLKFVKPSRRSWDRVSKLIKAGAAKEIELELIMGIVGLEPALAFQKHRETNFKSLKADIVLNDYASVRKDVLAAITKSKTDLLGTLNEELDALLKTMDKLTMNQADNLAELIDDLPAEHAFALGIITKNNQQCTLKIENFDTAKMCTVAEYPDLVNPENLGMFAHKKFVTVINSVKAKRDAIKAASAPLAPEASTEIPF